MEQIMVRALRAFPAAVLALGLATAASAQQPGAAPSEPLKFAWLNSQTILAATPGRPAAESLFAREMAGARSEVQRLQSQLDTAVAEYQRAAVTMTPAAKSQREDQLRQMEARNRQRAQDLDQQMQAREAELTSPIMQRVNSIIEGVRAEFNYAFIFDVASQANQIVAADPSLNITNLIVQRLQAAGPAPTATPTTPAPGGPPMATTPTDSTRPPAARPPQQTGPRVRPRP
jgi:outer membrane protein